MFTSHLALLDIQATDMSAFFTGHFLYVPCGRPLFWIRPIQTSDYIAKAQYCIISGNRNARRFIIAEPLCTTGTARRRYVCTKPYPMNPEPPPLARGNEKLDCLPQVIIIRS